MRGIALFVGCLAMIGAIAPGLANDTPPLAKDAPPSAKEIPLVKDAPAVKDAEPSATQPMPPAREAKQSATEATPPVNDATPAAKEATPPEKEGAPSAKEPTPAANEAAPAAKEATAKEACPGHPDAIGTSRVLTVEAGEFSLLGTIQYKQTLPLKDHEVVLTFDDGPIPPYSQAILDTLESQCVKATYFMVGEMAHNFPYMVRRIYNAGNTIGTHSEHHPFAFQRLSAKRVESEVDGGIASVEAALGDPKAVSPFFRIPGFGRTKAIESFLESKGLVTWSADVDTDDWWRGTTPKQIVQRAMRRLNAKGRGIVLLHDIHPATALALPMLLKELKANGYHVVQVVAAGERPKSVPEIAVAHETDKSAWPRIFEAKMEHSSAGKRHNAKAALRHHRTTKAAHSARKKHRRAVASLPPKNSSADGRSWQRRQF